MLALSREARRSPCRPPTRAGHRRDSPRSADSRARRSTSAWAASICRCSTAPSQVLMSPGVSLDEPIAVAGASPRHRGAGRHRAVRARGARAGDRRHRHQRQEHGDQPGRAHGRGRRTARARRRQSGCAGAGPSGAADSRLVRARAVELSIGDHVLARAQGRGGAQRHRGSLGPLRVDRRLCTRQGAYFRQGRDRGAERRRSSGGDDARGRHRRGGQAWGGVARSAARPDIFHAARRIRISRCCTSASKFTWRAAASPCSISRA